MDMNFNAQQHRKSRRLERLMTSGVLVGFSQRVKACFDFLDEGNNGWFALKDLTERGNFVSQYLGLGLDLSSTFSIMDAFRSFDVGIRGRVRPEDFGVSLIIRLLSRDDDFYNNLAMDVLDAGFDNLSKLLSAMTPSKPKDEVGVDDSDASTPSSISKIFSAVPFASDQTDASSSLSLPTAFQNIMGTIYYLIKDVLVTQYGGASSVTLTETDIARALRNACHMACVEMKIQLQLSQSYIEKVWKDRGHEINDEISSLSSPPCAESSDQRVSLELIWKPPRKTEFGARVQFEMTDATTLKGQLRRSGSVLHESKPAPREACDSVLGKESASHSIQHKDDKESDELTFAVDQLLIEGQPKLDTSQLFMLKSAIDNIDKFFAVLRNPKLSLEDKKALLKEKDSASKFSLGGVQRSRVEKSDTKKKPDAPGLSHASSLTESELSVELMDTQDRLRRTLARLEIFETIQMDMKQSAVQTVATESDSVESQSDEEGEEEAASERDDSEENRTSVSRKSDPVQPEEEVTYDSIMSAIQDVRALVSERGGSSMTTGALMSTPSAILPLQDVEDNRKSLTANEGDEMSGGAGEDKQQPPKGILSKISSIGDKKKRKSRKTAQVSTLIQIMNSSLKAISDEISSHQKNNEEMEKIKLLSRNKEEKAAEASVLSEQKSRQDENAAALAVEIQVLRDRIQHVGAMESENESLKNKNLQLSREVKNLERIISEGKEAWNHGNADDDEMSGASKTLVELENKILKLKEENNELRADNAKLEKEQNQHIMTAKNAEKRLKLCLQDNLALNQKLNRLEEDYNNSKIEVSDLLGQIEHQRDTEQERLQVSKKLHTTGLLVTELRGKLLEARAEALHANKLRDDLAAAEMKISKLMEAASEAEITSDSNHSAKQEVEELNAMLRQKMKENRELSITVRSLERKVSEGKTVQSRLSACQDEVNRYKIKVEQCAPMLAEVARLRGTARAAVRSLQEQDKTIVTSEDTNRKLRKKLEETTANLKRMERVESKLIESESECSRLSDIVLTEIPQLKEDLANVINEKMQIETQYRQLKKSSRQSAVTGTSSVSSASGSSSSSTGVGSAKPSPVPLARKQSFKPSATNSPATTAHKKPPPPASSPGAKSPNSPAPSARKVPQETTKKEDDSKPPPPPPPPASEPQKEAKTTPPPPPPPAKSKEKPPPPPPPSAEVSSGSESGNPSIAENKKAFAALFKPR